KWTHDNVNRVWNEGACNTSNVAGSRAIFTFTGTGVSWIGCQKESCSGVAKVFVDGAFVKEINNWRPVPIEAFQHDIFRVDGLTPGTHTLMIEQQINGATSWWTLSTSARETRARRHSALMPRSLMTRCHFFCSLARCAAAASGVLAITVRPRSS